MSLWNQFRRWAEGNYRKLLNYMKDSTIVEKYAIALCKAEFVKMFDHACDSAGGGSWETLKKNSLEDVVDVLARNGLRIVYADTYHMSKKFEMAEKLNEVMPYLK